MEVSNGVDNAAAYRMHHTVHTYTTKALVRILIVADKTACRMSLADDRPMSIPGNYRLTTENEAF
jgi:hypothetical protein